MDIVIYGIPSEIYRCHGCLSAVKLLDELKMEYKFIPVLYKKENDLGFDYDRDMIVELAKKLNQKSLAITYPKIFIDGELIGGFAQLKEYLNEY